ncbi:MAG: nitrilase-related carbon-nitrogen hydrolase, partial [Desulfobulbaceae bacterium]|nr:nitrilase-related carbon-nitrogen hydrolase [Desulfobulbaceae bacterium]
MHQLLMPAYAGFVQFDVIAGAYQDNLASVRRLLDGLNPGPGSLIVLPELWATGFAYDRLAELAEVIPDMVAALQDEAARYQCVIAGSLPEYDRVAQLCYNTLFLVGSQGIQGSYRKQQLFSPMAEDLHFTPGDAPQPVMTELGLVACLICYDLRFPDLARRQVGLGAGLIVVSAQWPSVRQEHWRTLLKARAIENQAFVVASNRCGMTGDTSFGGGSVIIDPSGRLLAEAGGDEECGLVRLEPQAIAEVRQKFC